MNAMLQFVKSWADDIIRNGKLNNEETIYIQRAWRRYSFVLHRVKECVEDSGASPGGSGVTILDIGPHFFTTLLKKLFPEATINTLGYENYRICPPSIRREHLTFNLNDAQYPERWPAFGQHDIIVMGEVIEHLYTAPWLVLRFIKTLLKNNGALVLTTPNAASINNRIFLMLGRNPFEMLREGHDNPGHIREYTSRELIDIGQKAGLATERVFLANYFVFDNFRGRLLFHLTGFIPSLRNGITVVYRGRE